jgi:predicted ATPase/DNA-binding SARP family transcriptional activator
VATSDAEQIDFRLLGPIEAVRDGETLALGGPRQRALLGLLLLEPGRSLSADRLADELWGERPPPGAPATIRSYVSRLRSVLGPGAPIEATSSGYALSVSRESVDATRFERLVQEGQDALARGQARRAADGLRGALELWRGRPFNGAGDEGALKSEAERLDELRLLALEERIQADLALGSAAELVHELEGLVREHPYRERFWAQLMLALYRAGRQADALDAYRRGREILAEELGLEPSENLKQLEQAILRQEVPEVKPPEERHNLPAPVTGFVGREAELAEIERLLSEGRLVTLTGVGGVGKTRLALEAAARAIPNTPDGVFFVDFAGLGEAELVPRYAARSFDLGEQPGRSAGEQLTARLRDADLLLVLDNCEHLREACAELAQSLLAASPRLRILATSRVTLGVSGEVDFPVSPLELPAADLDPDELRSSEAVQLFLARAREARHRLEDDQPALASAARICRDVDGLPLAIELAAARAKALSLEEIADRLSDRFRFLVSWRRLTAARHRTLEEAMDWSYELLTEDERALLRELSVFTGGFAFSAAVAVCLGDEARGEQLLGRLVDASLVVAEEREGAMRYHLLETVRQYAGERLEETGEGDAVRRRHAEWCLALAEEAEPQLTGEEQTTWFATLEAESDNLRSALVFLGAAGEYELRLRLAVSISRFWYVRGYLAEARRWLEEALAEGAEDQPLDLRRRALTAAAAVALLQGEYADSTSFAEQALAAAREAGDDRFVANGLSNLGAIVLAAGDHERAAELLEEAVGLARKVGDTRIAALAINNLGDLALTVGDYERAEPLFEESLALLEERGDTSNLARSQFNLGAVALQLGRADDARVRFREALELVDEAGDKEDLAWCLEGTPALAGVAGRGEDAALLLGAAGSLIEAMEADFKPFERKLHEATEEQARGLCGDRFQDAVESGAALPLPEALSAARAELG